MFYLAPKFYNEYALQFDQKNPLLFTHPLKSTLTEVKLWNL